MPAPDLTYCHFAPTPVTSVLTGRTIYVSESVDRYAVLPEFTAERLADARTDFETHVDVLCERRRKPQMERARRDGRVPAFTKTPRLRSGERMMSIGLDEDTIAVLQAVFEAPDQWKLGAAVDAAVGRVRAHAAVAAEILARIDRTQPGAEKTGSGTYPVQTRVVEAFLILWRHGLLAFPAGEMWPSGSLNGVILPDPEELFYGSLAAPVAAMKSVMKYAGQKRPVSLLFPACGGAREVGDVDGAAMGMLARFGPVPAGHQVYGMCDELHDAQEALYRDVPHLFERIPQSYRVFFQSHKAPRSDITFAWAAEAGGERLEGWRVPIAMYCDLLPNRISTRMELHIFNALFDYLLADPSLPGSPLDYCRRDFTPGHTIGAYLEQTSERTPTVRGQHLSMLQKFFDWVIETEGVDAEGVVRREYRNPVRDGDIPAQSGSKGQTHRTAIPLRYLRMMRDILEADDYAWPRTLQADYMTWRNPETGAFERVWSPVRMYFYLLRLMIPIRGLQARLLDSGEADAEVYRPAAGGWVRNHGRHAPSAAHARTPQCLVRRIWDHVQGRHFNGLFITTNKTQDRVAGFTECGYEIPWEHQEVIDLFSQLRDWQEKYNPLRRPLSRAELSDPHLRVSSDVAPRLEKYAYLFRDAADPSHPQEPPSDGRLQLFWRLLVAELEDRLASATPPITNSDGSRIVLVERVAKSNRHNAARYPKSTIFDPHSLRVAGLTALAGVGVPLHVLSKFVAGHATVLMTLYYNKLNAGEITRVLDEAMAKLPTLERRNWDAYVRSMPTELVHEIAAYNSEDGLRDARNTQSALWALMDDGFCPNSATRCAEGGPLLTAKTNRPTHAPVPGGARNCALCRFWVTGPAFLAGQVAKFNATAAAIREALLRFQQRTRERAPLLKAKLDAERQGVAYADTKKLERIEEVFDGINEDIGVLSSAWAAQHVLIKRSETILNREMRGQRQHENALVLTGSEDDFRAALEECSELDLLDRVCQDSVFHAGVNAQVPALRRGRLLDAMLAREGQTAVFAALDDEQIVAVGNAAMRFLRTRIGRVHTNDLVAGRTTLAALGLTAGDIGTATGETVLREQGVRLALPDGASA